MSGSGLRFTLELAAPPERVYPALTEAPLLCRWLCDDCESEPRANGRLIMRWRRPGSGAPFEARWVEFSPPARAAFQGGNSSYPNGDAGTVWFSLVPDGPATRLEIRHEWPRGDGYDAPVESWRSAWPRALERLKQHVEHEA